MTHTVSTTVDVEYATTDGASLQMDLHRPDVDAAVPVVVYFHGGGWARGSRKDGAEERLLAVAAQGVAVASVSYRLIDVATHPAQLEDARAAVRWLRRNATERGLQSERIGAWGASAGGWIALMLALTDDHAGGHADATVAWFPVTNLLTVAAERRAAELPLPPFMVGRPVPDMESGLLGLHSLDEDPELARAASPFSYAAAGATAATAATAATSLVSDGPGPILLMHGDRDGMVNLAQSTALHEALTAAGRDSQLMVVAGANHEDPSFHTPAVLATTAGFFTAAL